MAFERPFEKPLKAFEPLTAVKGLQKAFKSLSKALIITSWVVLVSWPAEARCTYTNPVGGFCIRGALVKIGHTLKAFQIPLKGL